MLSHVFKLEPQNTTAHVMADKAVIITPTQFQQLIPHVVAGATGLKPEQVEVQTTYLGGGFGRRWKWTTPSTPRRSPRRPAAFRSRWCGAAKTT
ncbi:MAG: molybdopterin-dependent oxidoreductase [Saprospiraceae bacterium]|nr:molybdopterin-dependent oxidoreductase [Saprospiraceae bacterium]